MLRFLTTLFGLYSGPSVCSGTASPDLPESSMSGGEVRGPQPRDLGPDVGGLDQRGPQQHHQTDALHHGAIQGEGHRHHRGPYGQFTQFS